MFDIADIKLIVMCFVKRFDLSKLNRNRSPVEVRPDLKDALGIVEYTHRTIIQLLGLNDRLSAKRTYDSRSQCPKEYGQKHLFHFGKIGVFGKGNYKLNARNSKMTKNQP